MRPRSPFKITADGTVKVTLAAWKRQLLTDLPQQLQELMSSNSPSNQRLFPAAYVGDEEREEEYQRYMREELLASRMAAATILCESAKKTQITTDELATWVNVCNSIRLVLGTQLDVSEDDDPIEPDDPNLQTHQLYWWLGFMVECGVQTLSKGFTT